MRPSSPRARSLLGQVLAAAAVAAAALPGGAAGAGVPTRLGRAHGPGLSGFGLSRPRRVFLGGDPTGLLERIHWSSWGGARANGTGEAEYVWPGTAVAANPIAPGARVVAFHLGTCRGVRSYNAVEWYFPRYGESFNPRDYFNTCTGRPVAPAPMISSCPDVTLADGTGKATSIIAIGLSCASASPVIMAMPAAHYLPGGGRFSEAGYRCGSEGVGSEGGSPLFACQLGMREFSFSLEP